MKDFFFFFLPELVKYIDKNGVERTDSKCHWYTGEGKGKERSKTFTKIAEAMADQWG